MQTDGRRNSSHSHVSGKYERAANGSRFPVSSAAVKATGGSGGGGGGFRRLAGDEIRSTGTIPGKGISPLKNSYNHQFKVAMVNYFFPEHTRSMICLVCREHNDKLEILTCKSVSYFRDLQLKF